MLLTCAVLLAYATRCVLVQATDGSTRGEPFQDSTGRWFRDGIGRRQHYACPNEQCTTPPVRADSDYLADPEYCGTHHQKMSRPVVPDE
jgi:hypothetical protein